MAQDTIRIPAAPPFKHGDGRHLRRLYWMAGSGVRMSNRARNIRGRLKKSKQQAMLLLTLTTRHLRIVPSMEADRRCHVRTTVDRSVPVPFGRAFLDEWCKRRRLRGPVPSGMRPTHREPGKPLDRLLVLDALLN
jgi:hypothetical protein